MDGKYLGRKMVGWLSFNPNFEARDAQYKNNKVCYFYPRFLLQNGSYIPINNKKDFPQVGRIAVWIQGGDDAESVVERYGNLVCATLNRSLECNYESNNYYTARYNYDYGPKSSEMWLATIDASSFYEVVDCFQSIDYILKNRGIDIPVNFTGSTKYILLSNHRTVYGPFAYNLQNSRLNLQGISNYNFLIGEYLETTIEHQSLFIRDNQDVDAVALMPVELLPPPASCKASYDLIDNEDLLNQFLEQAKIRLDLNRKDFREIKDYITRVLTEKNVIELTDSRLSRLQSLLTKVFDAKNHILDTFNSLMTDPDISQMIVQELLKKYPDTLKESLALAVGVNFQPGSAAVVKESSSESSDLQPMSLPASALPYSVINSFFTSSQMQTLIGQLQEDAQQISNKIEQINDGCQILNSPDLELVDFISTANFYPDYREQLQRELAVLYNSLDQITSFLDQVLERNGDNNITDKNTDASSLKELSIRLSRIKERLTRRKKLLDNAIKAEEIDLTLDRLESDESTSVDNLHCTLADVLKDGHLLSQHSVASWKSECNRLRQIYHDVDTYKDLETQITSLTETKNALDTTITELSKQKTEQEEALQKITNDFKQLMSPIKDQYQLAAKLLDHNFMQSAMPAPNIMLNTAQGVVPATMAQGATTSVITNIGVVAQAAVQTTQTGAAVVEEPNAPMTNLAGVPIAPKSEYAEPAETESTEMLKNAPESSTDAPISEKPVDLKPLFDVECLDNMSKFQSRKQLIEHLSVFFNKHASRNISNNELANYLICITQGFITTFAGEPGTGKTSLCNLLARSLGLVREDQNNRFVEISVERGWTSLKDFIGYYNPLTKRMEKSNSEIFDAFSELNKEGRALKGNPNSENYIKPEQLAPFFILLDEANLSPIEHYWAAFFRNCDEISKQQRTISLGGKANWYLPENLRFLATINIDHTTEELSARFLDRSWVITLDPQKIELDSPEGNEDLLYKDKIVPFAALKQLFSPQSEDTLPKDLASKWQEIQEIFASSECAMPIRPRNLKMVHNYCLVASSCMNCHGDNGRLAPLDYAIAQKILPTINGNGERYSILISKLQESCTHESMPLCAKHIERMQRAGNADLGFYQFFSR